MSRSWVPQQQRTNDDAKLVEYIVLAEFDIDTGSTVRHIYPERIPNYKHDYFAEYMLPEGAHNRDMDCTYIFLNRQQPMLDEPYYLKVNDKFAEDKAGQRLTSAEKIKAILSEEDGGTRFLYGLNVVKTKYDKTVRRGAIVKAMAIFTPHNFVEAFKGLLDFAIEQYFSHPTVDTIAAFYQQLNAIDLSNVHRPNYLEQWLMRRGITNRSSLTDQASSPHTPHTWLHTIHCQCFGQPVSLKLPLYAGLDEAGNADVSRLCQVFGEHSMKIFHAVLTKQRVLFVGYNHAAGDVGQMVLSAVAMVAPPLKSVIRRCYPYATLSDLAFLEVEGFVAGVTNPMFQQHESWWDVLCVLDLPNCTGIVYCKDERKPDELLAMSVSNSNASSNRSNASATHAQKTSLTTYEEQPYYFVDNKFVTGVLSAIDVGYGEDWVRQQFFQYTLAIVQHAQQAELMQKLRKRGGGSSADKVRRFVDGNQQRIEKLQATTEFRQLALHPWVWSDLKGLPNLNRLRQSFRLQRDRDRSPAGKDLPRQFDVSDASIKRLTSEGTVDETRGSAPTKESSITTPLASNCSTPTSELSDSGSIQQPNISKESAANSPDKVSSPYTAVVQMLDSAEGQRTVDEYGNMTGSTTTTRDVLSAARTLTGSELLQIVRSLQCQYHASTAGTTTSAAVSRKEEEGNLISLVLKFRQLERNLQTESTLQALIVLLPESQGGLLPLASGVFHCNPIVRMCAVNLMQNICRFESTKPAFDALNRFVLCGIDRQLRLLHDGTLAREVHESEKLAEATLEAARLRSIATGVRGPLEENRDSIVSGQPVQQAVGADGKRAEVVAPSVGAADQAPRKTADIDDDLQQIALSLSAPFSLLQETIGGFISELQEDGRSSQPDRSMDHIDLIP